jgi:succinate dehydrogenase / fumarate reductase cytochrome b subunit
MVISGAVSLAFLILHFIDFWIPEMNVKYVQGDMSGMIDGEYRYFMELQHKFENPIRVGAYVVSFVLLALHLMHGFQSAFQSIGFNNRYTGFIKGLGKWYSILVPAGFVIVALYHFFNH